MRTLLIDNYDSFTFNLYQLIATAVGVSPDVLVNDDDRLRSLDYACYDAVVVSPGPGHPGHGRDIGLSLQVMQECGRPVLGVCLGLQAMSMLAGARIEHAPEPRHGFVDRVHHDESGLFAGLPQGFQVVRYHSLCVEPPLPSCLDAVAYGSDAVVMAVRHRERPWWGVQFHPESVGTEHGADLMRNFAAEVGGRHSQGTPARRPLARLTATEPLASPGVVPTKPTQHASEGAGDPAAVPLALSVRRLDFAPDTDGAFDALFARSRWGFWLDSSRVMSGYSRFSFLGDSHGPLAEVLSYNVGSGHTAIHRPGRPVQRRPGSVFTVLSEQLAERPLEPVELPFPFTGGYVGYLGYELKSDCGGAAVHAADTDDSVWMFATRFLAVDHALDQAWLVTLDPVGRRRPQSAAWLDSAAQRLRALRSMPPPPKVELPAAPQVEAYLVRDRDTYVDDIRHCLAKLRDGETYEICLTNMAHVPFTGSSRELYRRLRRLNPAPYAALLHVGETHVLCSSPERFLKVDTDGTAESRPIKGTLPRGCSAAEDEDLRSQLELDGKSRAENLMIVDLVRNDLGRVCEIGSVGVPKLMVVESYETMHQLVSTVRGTLRDDVTAVDAARACFPGGSMTGAPKLRTMEIIDSLETEARGIYSGALGYFGLDGAADLNIVIRTVVLRRDQADVGAGGAIVLDSDEQLEYEEMLLKAEASAQSLDPRPGSSIPVRNCQDLWSDH